MYRSLPVFLPCALVVWATCAHDQKRVVAPHPPVAAAPREPVSHGPSPAAQNVVEPRREAERSELSRSDAPAIFFDFDSANLRSEAGPTLQRVANELKHDGRTKVRVEGNCDQLGTVEYNLALGEQRARAAKDYLQRLGVSPNRISIISYGSERPKFQGDTEDARSRNRRDDLLVNR